MRCIAQIRQYYKDKDARRLREAFRNDRGLYITCRRGIILTSFGAGLCMMAVGLYQAGITRRLHDPPLRRLDSSGIALVPRAFRPLGLPVPDSLLGLASYAATAVLAGLGEPERHRRCPSLVLLMTAKVFGDAALSGTLAVAQWFWYRSFCMYCLTASALTFVGAALAIPEARAALRQLRR